MPCSTCTRSGCCIGPGATKARASHTLAPNPAAMRTSTRTATVRSRLSIPRLLEQRQQEALQGSRDAPGREEPPVERGHRPDADARIGQENLLGRIKVGARKHTLLDAMLRSRALTHHDPSHDALDPAHI